MKIIEFSSKFYGFAGPYQFRSVQIRFDMLDKFVTEVHTHDPHGVDAEGVPDRNAKRRQGDRVPGETARDGHAERLPRELG